jgi:hypothetical protein
MLIHVLSLSMSVGGGGGGRAVSAPVPAAGEYEPPVQRGRTLFASLTWRVHKWARDALNHVAQTDVVVVDEAWESYSC